MAVSQTHKGWRFDADNDRLDIYYNGTRIGHVDSSGLDIAEGFTVAGASTLTGNVAIIGNADVTGDFTAGDSTTGNLIETDASANKIGFFGATPITVPELATSDAAGIITALVNLGLVTDSA